MPWHKISRPGIRTFGIAVFIAVLVIVGALGIWRLANISARPLAALAALFSFSRESIRVYADPNPAVIGEAVALGWEHEGKRGDGSYELSYLCRDDFRFLASSGFEVPCNAPFPVGAKQRVTLLPQGEVPGTLITMPVTVAFRPNANANVGVESTLILTVASSAPPSPPGEPAPPPAATVNSGTPQPRSAIIQGPTTRTTFPVSLAPLRNDPNGIPDLAIAVVAVGTIDPSGAFTATSSLRRSDQIGIVFEVTNRGTALSAPWFFTANLPTRDGAFRSPTQLPLVPGDTVRYTIGFLNPNPSGSNTAVFTIDPSNSLRDANRANDVATTTVLVSIP